MKNNQWCLIIFSVIFVLAISMYFYNSMDARRQVCFEEVCVEVEVVDTIEGRATGLMHRNYLAENSGMLFIFESEQRYPFWMKNTLIPLDIIWINENFEVVDIVSAEPCKQEPCISYFPREKAVYVLEVNKGFSEKKGIKVGDKINIY